MGFKISLLFTLVIFSVFSTVYLCPAKKAEKPRSRKELCDLPSDYGKPMDCLYDMSRTDIHDKLRFWFNKDQETCEMFVYGDCEGNENNFETWLDCMGNCSELAEL